MLKLVVAILEQCYDLLIILISGNGSSYGNRMIMFSQKLIIPNILKYGAEFVFLTT